MHKTRSLRGKLSIILCIIVIFQSSALILSLYSADIFKILNKESIETLNDITYTRTTALNTSIESLTGNLATESEALNEYLIEISAENNIEPSELYLNDEVFTNSGLVGINNSILTILKQNYVTGAFVVLNGSNTNKYDSSAHSAVFVKNSDPYNFDKDNLFLSVGPNSLSEKSGLSKSLNWTTDISEKNSNIFPNFNFYDKPTQAVDSSDGYELSHYGFWSIPDKYNENLSDICYSVPLIDKNGVAYGVVGIEIDLTHLVELSFPDLTSDFENSFYIISRIEDNRLNLKWYLPSSPNVRTFFGNIDYLVLQPFGKENLYTTSVDTVNIFDLSVSEIKLYDENSYFNTNKWVLSYFVEDSILKENSNEIRDKVIFSIFFTTLLAFVAGYILVVLDTRKISGLSKYVENLSPFDDIDVRQTGLRETDELLKAIKIFNDSLITQSKTTSKILELSLLPIGGYEIVNNSDNVILTEFLYTFLNIDFNKKISLKEWEVYFSKLTKTPHLDYKDIYKYHDLKANKTYWLRILQSELETGSVGVVLDVTDDITENIRLANEVDFDRLTSLYSQAAFRRHAQNKITQNPDSIGAMIFIDLDNLKYINDSFGHELGDILIIQASKIFRYFENYGGIISRISGDEFAVYLHGFDSYNEVRDIFNQLYTYGETFSLKTPDGNNTRIRFTAGVAWYPNDATNINDLIRLSDFAMYEAKRTDKGNLFEFDKNYYSEMSYILENRENISNLLDNGLIHFAFQPIVDLKTGEIYAYEALMRSLMPNFTSPLEIIAVASAQSKLIQLEKLILTTAFKTVETNMNIIGNRKIFINSIPNPKDSLVDFQVIIDSYRHLFDTVVLEIIETDSTNENNLREKTELLRDLGLKIAIDDFGAGYSNELRILNLSPDIIKIDMELIRGIHIDSDKEVIVTSIVKWCHSKGILVVAEGVEIEEDLFKIIEIGVDLAQGYYLAKPEFGFVDIPEECKKEILSFQEKVKNQVN